MTTAAFIAKAKQKHGETYDYSSVEYVNSYTEVTIVCPERGPFEQRPHYHVNGQLGRGGRCGECVQADRVNTSGWIEKARVIHGDRFGYERVDYVDSRTTVSVRCPDHGFFDVLPTVHVRAAGGCPPCAGRGITTAEFVARAIDVHGDRYDYSRARYMGRHSDVEIICGIHGSFWQTPGNHVGQKSGCLDCSGKRRFTTAGWIEKARAVHGDRYDYSQVVYVDAKTKVLIVCPEHGAFEQYPSNHVSLGQGCSDCVGLYSPTTEEWVAQARAVHGDKFGYDSVVYVNSWTDVVIRCFVHGNFEQAPTNHVHQKQGCPRCAGKGITTFEWIERAKAVHGNRYDYSQAEYQRIDAPVTIICSVHGTFDQTPREHVGGGCGCPRCTVSRGEYLVACVLEGLEVNFVAEWSDPTCRSVNPLPFDFHLTDLKGLIEFDGIQHFEPVRWCQSMTQEEAESNLLDLQRRDEIKNAWAAANGYPLLRVSDLKQIEQQVTNFVKELKGMTNMMIAAEDGELS
ncbi:hypothetical protein ACF08M_30215 [Streptomyces sp. NPDC015032]|uniref:hypothetical protein n=1 Tax=Streptomyces sp. NPDC015032 TaxID=3364937 RepID=UPI0036FC6B4A